MKKVDNPSQKTLNGRVFRERHKHSCLDCGGFVTINAIRCKSCAAKVSNAKFKKPSFCIDCGKPTSRGRSLRCFQCAAKTGRKGNWLDDNRYIAGNGYIMIRDERGHNNGGWGYIGEHIKVWEIINGRKLPKGWHVHHINGVKTDNRPSNLAGLPNRKHRLVLAIAAKKIQELEGLLRQQGHLL